MWNIILLVAAVAIGATQAQVLESSVEFYLWNSRANRERVRINNYGQNFDRNADVKILIHGWTESINSFWYADTRASYVARGANVVAVDWSRHAQLTYPTAVSRLSDVGSFIASFIIGLSNSHGIPLSRFHVVGHSLGAHLGGFTGQHVLSNARSTIGRISGLDPAGPSFLYALNRNRLSDDDATQVDTILTDAGLSGLGINRSLGHVNFWPNGGTGTQPGCLYFPCSHNRAPRYFQEGIASNRFVARRCSSYTSFSLGLCRTNPQNILGQGTNFGVTGDFYLDTNSRSPFARG